MPDNEQENSNAEEGENGEGSQDGNGDGDSGRSLREYVEDIVRQVMGSGDSGGSSDAGKSSGEGRSSAAGTESSIAAMVRAEQAKLMKEQEREAADKRRDEEIAALKKATEKPPVRNTVGARLQRFMWGDAG